VFEETIVAIATPPGRSGIGVIRLSGPQALGIAARLTRQSEDSFTPNHARHLELFSVTDKVVDDAVVLFFKAPKSFTGEDVVEISAHGNPLVLADIIGETVAAGAIGAGPGEFSMRAFLNGKIDLSQAEAIGDLIGARTSFQVKLARMQMHGALAERLKPLKEELLNLIVQLESAVEFVEDDISTDRIDSIKQRIAKLVHQFDLLLGSFDFGKIVREGLKIGIVGRPNVGKSSVFNRLLKADRAIVTDIPGTTRDILTEGIEIGGIPVTFIDTAGIRESQDVVESLGIERSRSVIGDADLLLLILDTSEPLAREDMELIESCKGLKHLLILNKSDIQSAWGLADVGITNGHSYTISAKTGEGIDELMRSLESRIKLAFHADGSDPIVTNARHHASISVARNGLVEATEAMDAGLSEEVALVGLHLALRSLGEITGETIIDDILNKIFGTFCIGK